MPRRPADIQDANYVESDRARIDLTNWLSKHTGTETEEGFEMLCTVDSKTGAREIGTFRWDLDETIDKVAEEIIDDCEKDCLRFRGKMKYTVQILSTTGRAKKCTFSMHTPSDMEEGGNFDSFDNESPDIQGGYGQALRHTEVFAREMVGLAKCSTKDLKEQLAESRAECRELKRDWFEQKRLYEDMLNMQFARDREIKKDIKSEERKEEAMKAFKQILPFIANKVLGQGQQVMDPGPMSPSELQLASLLESLDGDQQMKFMEFAQTLNPVQQAIFADLQQSLMAKQQASQTGKAESSNGQQRSSTHQPFSSIGSAGVQPGR
jgi:hypothetical protein